MKRMLINASHSEELRVALVDGQKLYDLDIEPTTREQKKSNIYKGRVTRVEPSLEAAFVDFGAERHGFLPLKEVAREYFSSSKEKSRPNIKEALREGQEIILQVEKEERGNKGAAISTFISLAGRYLVLMPNNSKASGISRRIEGEDRDQLREAMNALEAPKNMGYIIRTAGIGRSSEELQLDLDYLLQLWDSIQRASESNTAPILIYQESNVVIRAVRDYLRQDIDEVLIDDAKTYQEAKDFVDQVMPQLSDKIKLYQDKVPLFSRYQIESQIETAFEREVRLPSGGSIVIDHTEALVSIDINSAKATKGGDIEETAVNTNLEAADEIARQLRLRDIGGLLVIDFIDMTPAKNQRAVENRMRDALTMDRARVQVGRISRFGLLELSRQRLRPSLGETSGITCPRCNGQGTIRDVPSTALSVMRLLEEEALKDSVQQLHAQLPINVATYLLNEKREAVFELEKRLGVRVLIIPNKNLESPHYEVSKVKDSGASTKVSFELSTSGEEQNIDEVSFQSNINKQRQAAVSMVQPKAKPPEANKGFLSSLKSLFAAPVAAEPEKVEKPAQAKQGQNRRSNNQSSNNSNNRNNNNRNDTRNNNNRNKNRQENSRDKDRDNNKDNRNKNAGRNNQNSGRNKPNQDKRSNQDNRQKNQGDKSQNNNADKQVKNPQGNKQERNDRNSNRNNRNRNEDKRTQQNNRPERAAQMFSQSGDNHQKTDKKEHAPTDELNTQGTANTNASRNTSQETRENKHENKASQQNSASRNENTNESKTNSENTNPVPQKPVAPTPESKPAQLAENNNSPKSEPSENLSKLEDNIAKEAQAFASKQGQSEMSLEVQKAPSPKPNESKPDENNAHKNSERPQASKSEPAASFEKSENKEKSPPKTQAAEEAKKPAPAIKPQAPAQEATPNAPSQADAQASEDKPTIRASNDPRANRK